MPPAVPIAETPSPGIPSTDLVGLLADPHRSVRARQRLIGLGPQGAAAARQGLGHPDARVREYCCKVLDHVIDAASIPGLILALRDQDERVRIAAAHALACDRCKGDSCRPAAAAVLSAAMAMLAGDLSAHARAHAAELVGRWVHSHHAACDAIEQAAARDPSPAVRKKASWYAPGGPIYQRTKPRQSR
jgi:HEAT repeat protein